MPSARWGFLANRRTGIAAVVAASAVAISVVLVSSGRLDESVLEALLMLGVLVPVLLHPAVFRPLKRLRPIRKLLVVALIALTFVGHVFFSFRTTFPFVPWRMYGTVPSGNPVVYEYRAILVSGRVVDLVPSRVLPGITAQRFSAGILLRLDAFRKSRESRVGTLYRRHAELILKVLAREYSRSHPEDPITTVLVYARARPLGERASDRPSSVPSLLLRVPAR